MGYCDKKLTYSSYHYYQVGMNYKKKKRELELLEFSKHNYFMSSNSAGLITVTISFAIWQMSEM